MPNSAVITSPLLRLAGPGPELIADQWWADAPPSGGVVYPHGGGQTRHSWARTCRRHAGAHRVRELICLGAFVRRVAGQGKPFRIPATAAMVRISQRDDDIAAEAFPRAARSQLCAR